MDVERRTFLMTTLLTGLPTGVARAAAAPIRTDATGLVAGEVRIPVSDGQIPAYAAHPATAGPWPTILVVEEIFGVHDYIQDVCRRFAKLGYLAVAPELYAREGDFSAITDPQQIVSRIIDRAPDATVLSDLDSTADWAFAHGGDTRRLGINGFCRGGRDVWLYAEHSRQLRAAVAWYGPVRTPRTAIQPRAPLDLAGSLHCPLLGLYGGADPSIDQADVQRAAALARAGGEPVTIAVFPEAGHGFHADYRASYDAAAAKAGWAEAIAFLRAHGVG